VEGGKTGTEKIGDWVPWTEKKELVRGGSVTSEANFDRNGSQSWAALKKKEKREEKEGDLRKPRKKRRE